MKRLLSKARLTSMCVRYDTTLGWHSGRITVITMTVAARRDGTLLDAPCACAALYPDILITMMYGVRQVRRQRYVDKMFCECFELVIWWS
jgi:hypothetical protein